MNPYADFGNNFNGKTQEITGIVLQQQPENDFCINSVKDQATAAENLNNFNNNDVEMKEDHFYASNDTNNNSRNNMEADFGPETDVDAIMKILGRKRRLSLRAKKQKIIVRRD